MKVSFILFFVLLIHQSLALAGPMDEMLLKTITNEINNLNSKSDLTSEEKEKLVKLNSNKSRIQNQIKKEKELNEKAEEDSIAELAALNNNSETAKPKSAEKECADFNDGKHPDEYKLCLEADSRINSKKLTQSENDCKSMNVKGYEDEYKACLKISKETKKNNCEEVTEQYVICNGVKYIVDLKNDNMLKRDVKKIEDFVAPMKSDLSTNSVQK